MDGYVSTALREDRMLRLLANLVVFFRTRHDLGLEILALTYTSRTSPDSIVATGRNATGELAALHAREFHRQLAAGVPIAAGSDGGPFPHGTQAREFVFMVKYGMTPLATLQASTLNGPEILGWQGTHRRSEGGLPGRRHRHPRQSARRHRRG